jgi:hypothetical protein
VWRSPDICSNTGDDLCYLISASIQKCVCHPLRSNAITRVGRRRSGFDRQPPHADSRPDGRFGEDPEQLSGELLVFLLQHDAPVPLPDSVAVEPSSSRSETSESIVEAGISGQVARIAVLNIEQPLCATEAAPSDLPESVTNTAYSAQVEGPPVQTGEAVDVASAGQVEDPVAATGKKTKKRKKGTDYRGVNE